MDRYVAMQVLKLADGFDADELMESIEEAVFQTKSFLLTKEVNQKLWFLKIGQLEKLQSAFEALGGTESSKVPEFDVGVIDYLSYETKFYNLKTRLANSQSAVETVGYMKKQIELESAYVNWLEEQLKNLESTGSKIPINAERNSLIKLSQGNELNQDELENVFGELYRLRKNLSIK